MAKVSFNKICPVKEVIDKTININGEDISIKQYLPIDEKAKLISYIINNTVDDDGIASPVRKQIYSVIGILKYYTNINITDTMMKNLEHTFDIIMFNHIYDLVCENIEENELNELYDYIDDFLAILNNYNNSLAGAIKIISNNYKQTDFDLQHLAEQIQDPNVVGFIKDLLTKMN